MQQSFFEIWNFIFVVLKTQELLRFIRFCLKISGAKDGLDKRDFHAMTNLTLPGGRKVKSCRRQVMTSTMHTWSRGKHAVHFHKLNKQNLLDNKVTLLAKAPNAPSYEQLKNAFNNDLRKPCARLIISPDNPTSFIKLYICAKLLQKQRLASTKKETFIPSHGFETRPYPLGWEINVLLG